MRLGAWRSNRCLTYCGLAERKPRWRGSSPLGTLRDAICWPARHWRHGWRREGRVALRWSVRPNAYHDSVKLMRVSEELARLPGVERAAAVMATPLNLQLLADDGLLAPGVQATPEDLIIAVRGADEAADAALAEIDRLLAPRAMGGTAEALPARSLADAAARSGGNLAVIAVPGQFAAAEAYAALRAGLHVFLFSDNVAIEDEVGLKRFAARNDLLLMGPDCGTAIIGGVGLGFANRVKPGPIGIVGASGTGIQQLCSLLDVAGAGIAQAIGTGGRDLSAEVGGAMTLRGLTLLAEDDSVELICLISKPADPGVSERLRAEMERLGKPVIACLLGTTFPDTATVRYAHDLTHLADLVVETGSYVDAWAEEET